MSPRRGPVDVQNLNGEGCTAFFNGAAIWSSSAAGAPGVVMRFAEDGALSLYNAGGARVWQSTKTDAAGYAYMQRDGNLVVYSTAGKPVWATGTATGAAQ